MDEPSDEESMRVMEGVGTSPDHAPERRDSHMCTHRYTHTPRNTEKEQNSTSFQKEREGTGGESSRHTRAHTGTHTHRAGMTHTLEAKFNKAPRESGAR